MGNKEQNVKTRMGVLKASVVKLRNLILVLAIIVLIWGLGIGVVQITDHSTNAFTEDAQIEQYVSPIHIRASGYIERVYFTEHQHVHKGDTLLVLDNREYQIQVKQAQANLADARTGGLVLDATIERTKQSTTVYDNNIEELQIRLAQLEKDKQRYENLVAKQAATQYQLDQIMVEYNATRQKIESARRQKAAAKTGISEVTRREGNISAGLERAESALEQARLNLSYTVVTAPCDGQIGRRSIEEGQYVSSGTVITSIIPERQKWVIANYKERQMENIHVGQKVELSVDAISDREFTGHVSQIAGATGSRFSNIPTDNSAGNFVKIQQRVPVRIEFDGLTQKDYDLMAAGMMVEVRVKKK